MLLTLSSTTSVGGCKQTADSANNSIINSEMTSLVSSLVSKFLDQSPNVNHINAHQRTLLTYAVAQGDACLDLTRMLLNHGAAVVPPRSQKWRDRSAFTWLVRSVMGTQDLRSHHATLHLLCQNMADTLGPETMREHVLSTFLHLGHSA